MPIVNIIKRASNYILGTDDLLDDEEAAAAAAAAASDLIYEDNEVLFCKNNICVHPPAFARQESDILHYPGYLTVTTKTFIDQYNNARRPTLLLAWIPNATLRKCPSTVENAGVTAAALMAHQQQQQRQFSDELKQSRLFGSSTTVQSSLSGGGSFGGGGGGGSLRNVVVNTNPFLEPYYYNSPLADKKQLHHESIGSHAVHTPSSDNQDAISCSSSSGKASQCHSGSSHQLSNVLEDEDVFVTTAAEEAERALAQGPAESEEDRELQREMQPLLGDESTIDTVPPLKTLVQQHSVTSVNITIANPCIQNHDISPTESVQQQNDKFMRTLSVSSTDDGSPNWMTPELFAYKHNLAFPESATASPVVQRRAPLKCRR